MSVLLTPTLVLLKIVEKPLLDIKEKIEDSFCIFQSIGYCIYVINIKSVYAQLIIQTSFGSGIESREMDEY